MQQSTWEPQHAYSLVIALADAALYRAKARGRNQGIGIVPSDEAAVHPEAINLHSLRDERCSLVQTIETACPVLKSAASASGEHYAS